MGWEAWYTAHAPALLLYARQWCRHRADAEDALQEGFVGFWRQRGQAQDAKAYLFRCVRNAALARARGDARRRQREAAVAGSGSSSDRVAANGLALAGERDEIDALLRDAVGRLPRAQREVVVLKVWGDLTFAQIAEVTSASRNTAASRYRYAVAALQKQLPEACRP